jgi:hypothetical protein
MLLGSVKVISSWAYVASRFGVILFDLRASQFLLAQKWKFSHFHLY